MRQCNLREIRKQKNITQTALSKAAGISRQTINDMENGRRREVKSETLFALASALEVPIDRIFIA